MESIGNKSPLPIYCLLAFIGGILAVTASLMPQSIVAYYYNLSMDYGLALQYFFSALIEEVLKLVGAYLFLFKVKNKPNIIYLMVFSAAGFFVGESLLFFKNNYTDILLKSRVLHTLPLHIICSVIVGIAIIVGKNKKYSYLYYIGGLMLATVIHFTFNVLVVGGYWKF